MIAEEVVSKKKKRSLKGLVDYMLDTANDGEKVGYVSVSHCISDDPELALVEMQLTQSQNRRTKKDKTFHMVVSFPPGEVPTRAQMDDIEQSLADSIGMGHHQRISVSHTNTDNYHLHVAINKIDPVTHKMVNRYFYQRDMMRACTELELKHGLSVNSRQHTEREPHHAMDFHSGEQSFLAWSQKTLKPPVEAAIESAQCWDDIHTVLAKYGAELKKSGRGMAITSGEQGMKASALSRKLSLTQLEQRFGEFTPATVKRSASQYRRAPNSPLYDAYLADKATSKATKEQELARLKRLITKQRIKLKLEYALARAKVKNGVMSGYHKKQSYQRIAANHRAAQALVTGHYAKARQKAFQSNPAMTYTQYQQKQALEGNLEALQLLRRKQATARALQQGITGEGDEIVKGVPSTIDKHGVITYHYNGQTVKDNGKGLSIQDDSMAARMVLLDIAQMKYGHTMAVKGDDDYLHALKDAAEFSGLDIALSQAVSPVQAFIDKRNQDRQRIADIDEHRLYQGEKGRFVFGGYRNLGVESVILLKKGGVVWVKPIHRKELARYKAMKVGQPLNLPNRSRDTGIER